MLFGMHVRPPRGTIPEPPRASDLRPNAPPSSLGYSDPSLIQGRGGSISPGIRPATVGGSEIRLLGPDIGLSALGSPFRFLGRSRFVSLVRSICFRP